MTIQLLASAARTSSGNSGVLAQTNFSSVRAATFWLELTNAATDAGDSLDVYLQHSYDGGTSWSDFVAFTQILGNGADTLNFEAQWSEDPSALTALVSEHAVTDATLSAGSVLHGPTGPDWRIKWVVVDGGAANATFTFGVKARLLRRRR